jgi:pimeloyl-ACP methyl ester carboxylesterase
MTESIARVGPLNICYETFGDPADRPLLLVRGVYGQMIWWFDALCERLAAAGFHVIRFDNRDSGRSTHVDQPPHLLRAMTGAGAPPYGLDDLAADAFGLLDALGVESAHVAGLSMGGMVAQIMAIREPARVLSLTSIMSTTGKGSVGLPTRPLALRFLTSRFPTDPDAFVDRSMQMLRAQASPGFHFDEDLLLAVLRRSVQRGISARGPQRQMAAVLAAHDRTRQLQALQVPTLVLHGTADSVIGVSGGKATAAAVAGSELVLVPGMSHDLPQGMWSTLVEGIVRTAARAAEHASRPEGRGSHPAGRNDGRRLRR